MTHVPKSNALVSERWGDRWKNLGKNSILKQTQEAHPEKWQNFYDEVSDVWENMAGISVAAAQTLAVTLADQGMIPDGCTILEVGCGPGNLSMALAEYGCQLTAMDLSRGMIRILEHKISISGLCGIRPVAFDWNRLNLTPGYDLVVAAFFPEAFCPEGVSRMENLAKKSCVLVVGTGQSAFPICRRIWAKIVETPCPVGGDHLICAENYLAQTGRTPRVYRLTLPAVLDVAPVRAKGYFRSYFGMLGYSGTKVDKAIDDGLSPYIKNGCICLEGTSGAAMICWDVAGHRRT